MRKMAFAVAATLALLVGGCGYNYANPATADPTATLKAYTILTEAMTNGKIPLDQGVRDQIGYFAGALRVNMPYAVALSIRKAFNKSWSGLNRQDVGYVITRPEKVPGKPSLRVFGVEEKTTGPAFYYQFVLVKQGGRWYISAILPMPTPTPTKG